MTIQSRTAELLSFGLRAAAALALVAGVAACASAARPTAIVAPATKTTLIDTNSPLYQSMTVGEVNGGEETTITTLSSQVSNASFREALTTSLRLNGFLSDEPEDDFIVDATIVSVEQPTLQLNFTTTATVSYLVRSRKTNQALYEQTVTSSSEAKFTDSIVRSERIRLATQGAMRENIAQFLSAFSADAKANPYPYFQAVE